MTLVVTHPFVSAVADGGDATLVRPSNWNANHTLTGAADVTQGGTGLASGTSGGVLYFSGSTTVASSALLAANALVIGGGAGTAPFAASGTTWDNTNLALTIAGATVTANNPILNLSQTWNNAAVTFTALKLNVTNTASAAASLLLDLQVASGSKFNVDVSGNITGNTINSGIGIGATDALLFRDAAQIIAQRNGVNAQTLRVYNTFTDASNYERAIIDWTTSANVLTIGTQAGGTGTKRAVSFVGSQFGFNPGSGTNFIFGLGGPTVNYISLSHGAVGANDICAFTDGEISLVANGAIIWYNVNNSFSGSNSDTSLSRAAAKVLRFGDASSNANGWIQWGGQARVTSDFSKTSDTALANVTGLTVNVAAGRTYSFRAVLLMVTGGAAGGIQIALGGTCTVTDLIADGFAEDGTATLAHTRVSALGSVIYSVTNNSTTPVATIYGTITVNAAGTLTIQFAQNASNGTASTVKRGSYFIVHDMP